MNKHFDCVVIGGGPGGYVAAIKTAQAGLSTALIEQNLAGGSCLNRGCIPSKSLISGASIIKSLKQANTFGINVENYSFNYEAMVQRKDSVVSNIRKGLEGLIKSNKITIFQGRGSLISSNEVKVLGESEEVLSTNFIVLATGSEPRALPGIEFSSKILCSTRLLDMKSLPSSMAIIGGGVIGCEFASLFQTLNVNVSIFEAQDKILSLETSAISKYMTDYFTKNKIQLFTGTNIEKIEENTDTVTIYTKDSSYSYDVILVSIGRSFNTNNLGLEKAGVIQDERGCITVNEKMQTNIPNIYAIGDITGKWLLAHVASHQGIIAAENIAGKNSSMHYHAIPSVIFTSPEIASVGLTIENAQAQNIPCITTTMPFKAIGKAVAMGDDQGFATILSHKTTQQVLGAYIIGPHASSLIGEITLAINNELTLQSIFDTIHAHPTLSEIWLENALLAADTPLHMPPRAKNV